MSDSINQENFNNMEIFERNKEQIIGRTFYLDYDKAKILTSDDKKEKVNGIPKGTFLLAFYDDKGEKNEAILLRTLNQTNLPRNEDLATSMIEFYKENMDTSKHSEDVDFQTKYDFSFSGIECNVLGTFFTDEKELLFGSDIENFYSPNNYRVYKPTGKALEIITNLGVYVFKEGDEKSKIGVVKYSSSSTYNKESNVPVYVTSNDFVGKRTALFGMTRTGKSNTLKKIIELTEELNNNLPLNEKVGQIIFDINGEYANPNRQDDGTSISELLKNKVEIYSTIKTDNSHWHMLKNNFYEDIVSGVEIFNEFLIDNNSQYLKNFLSISWEESDSEDWSSKQRYKRKKAAYFCCLNKAGFQVPKNYKVNFEANGDIRAEVNTKLYGDDADKDKLNPKNGISLNDAEKWFDALWSNYDDLKSLEDYKKDHPEEWADDDLKILLRFLLKKNQGKEKQIPNFVGYGYLQPYSVYHDFTDEDYKKNIIEYLRDGKIVIIDLSKGGPVLQSKYSEEVSKVIFKDCIDKFTKNEDTNYIQFYFEEAHNLFPKKEDSNLSQIYNRIAKEGAKLNLGLIYATQEVSSISSNILKNTQNWFISHLNNTNELLELKKFYDFEDFVDSLIRFSPQDKGFVRMKTYSNPFVVPVQIDKFISKPEDLNDEKSDSDKRNDYLDEQKEWLESI
nr:DUF87 domain-containing protein [Methanobrevibacter arboriphilus]